LIKIIILEENFKWHLEAFASELFIYSYACIMVFDAIKMKIHSKICQNLSEFELSVSWTKSAQSWELWWRARFEFNIMCLLILWLQCLLGDLMFERLHAKPYLVCMNMQPSETLICYLW